MMTARIVTWPAPAPPELPQAAEVDDAPRAALCTLRKHYLWSRVYA